MFGCQYNFINRTPYKNLNLQYHKYINSIEVLITIVNDTNIPVYINWYCRSFPYHMQEGCMDQEPTVLYPGQITSKAYTREELLQNRYYFEIYKIVYGEPRSSTLTLVPIESRTYSATQLLEM